MAKAKRGPQRPTKKAAPSKSEGAPPQEKKAAAKPKGRPSKKSSANASPKAPPSNPKSVDARQPTYSLATCSIKDLQDLLIEANSRFGLVMVTELEIKYSPKQRVRDIAEEECEAEAKDWLFKKRFKSLAAMRAAFLGLFQKERKSSGASSSSSKAAAAAAAAAAPSGPKERENRLRRRSNEADRGAHQEAGAEGAFGFAFGDSVGLLLVLQVSFLSFKVLSVCIQLSKEHKKICDDPQTWSHTEMHFANVGISVNSRGRTAMPSQEHAMELLTAALVPARYREIRAADLSGLTLGPFPTTFLSNLGTRLPKLQRVDLTNCNPPPARSSVRTWSAEKWQIRRQKKTRNVDTPLCWEDLRQMLPSLETYTDLDGVTTHADEFLGQQPCSSSSSSSSSSAAAAAPAAAAEVAGGLDHQSGIDTGGATGPGGAAEEGGDGPGVSGSPSASTGPVQVPSKI
uniref:Uncharacterized protein n=1 Tax=Chromera velia CCMP2878 TaxID=1169474 RepID=A0A0G4HVV6_9ALVE|mmetsp:Transcript_46983/g.92757  ORF Transcript_46983/g.92757 Transcript_46983/m.92757 type:complete len:457 (+) Transcript_46983:174-1544(+)|eukprot:Cvel_1404.t1-p1 / transcript=Cvel_1404.t1 / gene=Cvel_1404 / organism=Chromera_velia_CCMP2878 / gene_product=hypothetical protein / transcript_product=hypothetical protein / location=Cvel_scaffold49:42319-45480(+) / protein_length=456 / sequence_SO=supercontig / SO=protein_coding / is_pseudo=false